MATVCVEKWFEYVCNQYEMSFFDIIILQ